MLDSEAVPLTTPEQPLYFVGRRHEAEEAREDSVNKASLTTLAGRWMLIIPCSEVICVPWNIKGKQIMINFQVGFSGQLLVENPLSR